MLLAPISVGLALAAAASGGTSTDVSLGAVKALEIICAVVPITCELLGIVMIGPLSFGSIRFPSVGLDRNEGGQAIVGSVTQGGRGGSKNKEPTS